MLAIAFRFFFLSSSHLSTSSLSLLFFPPPNLKKTHQAAPAPARAPTPTAATAPPTAPAPAPAPTPRTTGATRKLPRDEKKSEQPKKDEKPAPIDWKTNLENLVSEGYLREGDIDAAAHDALAALPQESANLAVQRLRESSLARVTNKSGFLLGIIRRLGDADGGRGGGGDDGDAIAHLAEKRDFHHVGRKLQEMVAEGRISNGDVDRRLSRALGDLGPRLAEEAVDKFAQANLESVRSKAGFFMGIVRRLERDQQGGGGGRGGGRGGYGDRGGEGREFWREFFFRERKRK